MTEFSPAWRALRVAYERCWAQAREASRIARRRPFPNAAACRGPLQPKENLTWLGSARKVQNGPVASLSPQKGPETLASPGAIFTG